MCCARGGAKRKRAVRIWALILTVVAVGTCSSCSGTPEESSSGPVSLSVPIADGKSWELVFSEEFEGTDYDRSKLSPCFDWNYGDCGASFNKGVETYKPEQVRLGGGVAKLVAEPLDVPEENVGCFEGLCTYKAGMLSTARPILPGGDYLFPFTYGYVEARVRYPSIPGFFTAFWLLPTDPSYQYQTEIDIAEVQGARPSDVHMTYAYADRGESYKVNAHTADDNGACAVRDYSMDWVKLGVDWQPDHIAWYINGVKCGEFTDAANIEHGPMQLILMLAVNNGWSRDAGAVVTDGTPAELLVDYIRIYQQK